MLSSSLTTMSENILDTVDLHRDVAWRYSGDLAYRCGIHAFEVREDHLPIQRLQSLDQAQEVLQRGASVYREPVLLANRHRLDIFETDETCMCSPPTDV